MDKFKQTHSNNNEEDETEYQKYRSKWTIPKHSTRFFLSNCVILRHLAVPMSLWSKYNYSHLELLDPLWNYQEVPR